MTPENSFRALHASPTAISLKSQTIRAVLVGVVASVFLAFVGALGTDVAPFGTRLAYWTAAIMPGSIIGLLVMKLISGWGRLKSRRWTGVAIVALFVSLPHCFIVLVVSALFFGIPQITLMVILQFWLAVFLIAIVLTAINFLALTIPTSEHRITFDAGLIQPETESVLPSALPLPEPVPPLPTLDIPNFELPPIPAILADKLPAHLRSARLVAIKAANHYLEIYTDRGTDLVLMRMADACAMLNETSGARVHRSWWVARSAFLSYEQQAGSMTLHLFNGLKVPVSRAMQLHLKSAGWFLQMI